jgi:transglutaminase-like putative cysteine protease
MAGIFTALLVMSTLMGAYSMLTTPALEGFSGTDLASPGAYSPEALPPLPASVAGNTTARPDVSVMIYLGEIYAGYGGSVRLEISNNDSRPMFLEEAAFTWTSISDAYSVRVNAAIQPANSHVIKALAIGAPESPSIWEYQISIRMLQYRNDRWYRVQGQGDDWLRFSAHNVEVHELPGSVANDFTFNPRQYFTKINRIVDFGSPEVADATNDATASMSGGFNMGKACAIFDWLDTNLDYTEDTGGGDVWYAPDETLGSMTGDCEDYAMLLAAMVHHAGGNSRIYLTVDHAFAAVYVGNTLSDLANATAGIRSYYRTDLAIVSFSDPLGHWVVADPLGSFHMGGFAVGQSPAEFYNGAWNTSFIETETLYAIDVTGVDISRPLWLDVNVWMGMMLITGFLAFGSLFTAQTQAPAAKTLCHICAGEITQDLYVCPHCQTTYHRACAFSKAYCMTCQKPIQYPPPPPLA